MRAIIVKLNGEDNFSLDVSKPEKNDEKKTVVVESLTAELPETGEEMVQLPKSVIEALAGIVKKQKEEDKSSGSDTKALIRELAEILAENGNDSGRRFLGSRPMEAIEIDASDVLSVPAIFFAHSVAFSVYDDLRNGHTIRTPYKRPFKFKLIERVVDGSVTRAPKYVSISAVIVRSKKEAEWLRAHSLNGIKFFEKINGVQEIGAELQDKLVKAHSIVSTMDDHSVIQQCLAIGIKVDTMDNTELRRKLTMKRAEEMLAHEKRIQRKVVQDFEDFKTGNIGSPEQFAHVRV